MTDQERLLRNQVVDLRNALREICDSSALTCVEDCRAIAEEALKLNALRFKVQHIPRPDEEEPSGDDERAQITPTSA